MIEKGDIFGIFAEATVGRSVYYWQPGMVALAQADYFSNGVPPRLVRVVSPFDWNQRIDVEILEGEQKGAIWACRPRWLRDASPLERLAAESL